MEINDFSAGHAVSAINPSIVAPTGANWRVVVENSGTCTTVKRGQSFVLNSSNAIIGRDPLSDIQLDDPTVSRRHLSVRRDGQVATIHNLSSKSTSYLNSVPLFPGESTSFSDSNLRIQLGRAIIRLEPVPDVGIVGEVLMDEATTQPFSHAALDPMLSIVWEHDHCHIRCHGRLMDLFPTSARILGLLCETPAEPVHKSELRKLVGPAPQLEQQITYIRRAFASMIDAGVLSVDEVRKQVRENSVGAHLKRLDTMDVPSLLRWFVCAKRGFGYVLHAQSGLVRCSGVPYYLMLQPGAPGVSSEMSCA